MNFWQSLTLKIFIIATKITRFGYKEQKFMASAFCWSLNVSFPSVDAVNAYYAFICFVVVGRPRQIPKVLLRFSRLNNVHKKIGSLMYHVSHERLDLINQSIAFRFAIFELRENHSDSLPSFLSSFLFFDCMKKETGN